MKRTLLVLAALAPLAAAACEPAVRSVTQSRLYSPTEFRIAAGGNDPLYRNPRQPVRRTAIPR